MKNLILIASLVALLLPLPTSGQVVFPNRGGLGTSTAPSYGQVPVGNGLGTYSPMSTSSLGIVGFSTTTADNWLSSKTTDNLAEGSTNKYYTDAMCRAAISTTATGLTYTPLTGVLSLTSGWTIPLTASTSEWATAYGWGNHATAGYVTNDVQFSTTSADYWDGIKSRWATSSSDHWLTTKTIGAGNGGTGITSYAAGDFLYAIGATTLARLAKPAAFSLLTETSAGNPSWKNISSPGFLYTTGTDVVSSSTVSASFIDAAIARVSALSSYLSLADWYATTTDALDEGSTNRYYTDARVGSYISGSSTIPHVGGSAFGDLLRWSGSLWEAVATSTLGIAWSNLTGIPAGFSDGMDDAFSTTSANFWEAQQTARTADDLSDNTTSDLPEGSNLYFTAARALSSLTGQHVQGQYFTATSTTATSTFPRLASSLLAGLQDLYVAGTAWLAGNVNVTGNLAVTGTSTLATTTAPRINDTIFVDGASYARTSAGINAALAACAASDTVGTVMLPSGTTTLTGIITLKPNCRLVGQGQGKTVLAIDASFADGVVMREQSGAAHNIELAHFTIDLAAKANVGGIHIYQGDNGYYHDLTIRNQGYTTTSRWTTRFGNFSSGNGTTTASHNVHVARMRLENNNSGTFEQVLFVNQWNGSFKDSYFKGNTNALAYELIAYINNKDVEFSGNTFEDGLAHSMAAMESQRISIHHNKIRNINAGYKPVTLINSRDVDVHHNQAWDMSGAGTGTFIDFFDRQDGPDDFEQLVDDTKNVKVHHNSIRGYKYGAYLQLAGLNLGTYYTQNQNGLYFDHNTFEEIVTTPFLLGADNASNTLQHIYIRNNRVESWGGTLVGAIQLRGYSTSTSQFSNIYIEGNHIAPSSGGANSAAIRIIGATVNRIANNYIVGTGQGYTEISFATGGTAAQIIGNIHTLLDLLIGKNSAGTTVFQVDTSGNATTTGLAVTGSATSTFANGINLSAGCFAVGGVCLTGSAQTPWTSAIDGAGYALTNVGAITGTTLTATATAATSSMSGGLTVDGTTLVVDYSLNRVGVGKINPQSTLDVNGIVRVLQSGTTNGIEGYSGTSHIWSLSRQATSSNGSLSISALGGIGLTGGRSSAASDNYHMYISNTGNVGIGTTSPYAKLSVVGNVVATAYNATGTGTSTFAGHLQVNGNITTLSSLKGGALNVTGASGMMSLYADSDVSEYNLGVNTSGTLSLFGSAAQTLNLALADGVLTVSGTATSSFAGPVTATAVYDDGVLLTDWLFDLYYDGHTTEPVEEGYKLLNINDTRKFAEKNRHLPTIDGREEWKKTGRFSIGKVVTQLWETVETQATHIFELSDWVASHDTRIETLEAENKALKERLEALEAKI